MQRRRFVQTLAAAVLTANAGVVAPQLWAQTVAQSAAAPLLEVFGKWPQSPARVFVAGPPAAMLVAALAPEALLGWPSRFSDDARAMLSPQLAALPTVGRLGGRGSSITTEALLALRPDVIVDVGTVDDYYRSQAQRTAAQTGIAYVLLDGRLPQTAQQLRELGALLGVVQRAELLAAYAERSLQQAQSLRAQLQAQPPRVYLARSADGQETGWRGAINAELLEYVGAQNVASQQDAAASERASAGSVGRVSFEQVLAWNPDLIVTQEAGLAARIRSSNLWRSVAAVHTGQVLQSPHLPFGWIDTPPGVNRLIGLRWLTLALQHWGTAKPAQVALLDRASQAELEQEARAFYQLFYGMQGEAAWPEGALPWH